jgi:hypothetical protein
MSRCALRAAVLAIALFGLHTVQAQDPAQGWTAYATAQCPEGTRITRYEADWKVLGNAVQSSAFYSPWFGCDASDNLNLLQPVNPWFGSSWSFYSEYFQWSPENNINSQSFPTSTGNLLKGSIVFTDDPQNPYYTVTQYDTVQQQNSTITIPVQQNSAGVFKNFTILYIVFEKLTECYNYPPDQVVTFKNINVECNGVKISPAWTAHHVDRLCDFEAHVESPSQVSITWNISSSSHPSPDLIRRSQANRKFGRRHL